MDERPVMWRENYLLTRFCSWWKQKTGWEAGGSIRGRQSMRRGWLQESTGVAWRHKQSTSETGALTPCALAGIPRYCATAAPLALPRPPSHHKAPPLPSLLHQQRLPLQQRRLRSWESGPAVRDTSKPWLPYPCFTSTDWRRSPGVRRSCDKLFATL